MAMSVSQFLDVAAKASQPLALIGGAIWGVYVYRRNRTHKHRLRLRVTAERVDHEGMEYLVIRTELENVGLERVTIDANACGVTIFADQTPAGIDFVWEPDWGELGTFDLLKHVKYLEPSSLVNDQVLVAVPGVGNRFLQVRAHAQSESVAWDAIAMTSPHPSNPKDPMKKGV